MPVNFAAPSLHLPGLKSHNGRILKPFQSKQRGERERDFYERVFVSEKDPPEFAALRQFLPEYHGTVVVREVEDAQEVNGLHPGRTWLELRAARFTA